jgi:hypothetical protein
MLSKEEQIYVFTINGGAGKNVLATAVVKALKKSNENAKIIVVTAYKEIWMYNPDVYRIYTFGNTENFYLDFVKDRENIKIFGLEPYSTNDYILKNKHLIDIWCSLVGVKYDGERPQVYFNQREVDYCINKYGLLNAPYFLIQCNGGATQDIKFSWMRDMPYGTANEVVDRFRNTHRIIQVRRDDQLALPNVEQFKGNLRELMILVKFSDKRLLIDSVCQHIACALDKPSTVLWVRNSPEILGYPIHDNIVTEVEDEIDVLGDSFLEPYDISGNIYQCPFKEGTKLFSVERIVNSLANQGAQKIQPNHSQQQVQELINGEEVLN